MVLITSSNQRLGECVRRKMDSQVIAKEQDCRQIMPVNTPQSGAMRMSERGIPSHVLEERLRDEPKEHLSAKQTGICRIKKWVVLFSKGFNKLWKNIVTL